MQVSDAAVLLLGTIVGIEQTTDFESKQVDGIKCLVATGDGYGQVKLKTELANQMKPQPNQQVAWLVRYGASKRGDGAATYSTFVGVAGPDYIDRLAPFARKAAA